MGRGCTILTCEAYSVPRALSTSNQRTPEAVTNTGLGGTEGEDAAARSPADARAQAVPPPLASTTGS